MEKSLKIWKNLKKKAWRLVYVALLYRSDKELREKKLMESSKSRCYMAFEKVDKVFWKKIKKSVDFEKWKRYNKRVVRKLLKTSK